MRTDYENKALYPVKPDRVRPPKPRKPKKPKGGKG